MLSTASLVKLGYVTGNLMTNLQPRNAKLRERAVRIIMAETGVSESVARDALKAANGVVRKAIEQLSSLNATSTERGQATLPNPETS
jgi:N-acetylmuramic acid 6-phosphate etherase